MAESLDGILFDEIDLKDTLNDNDALLVSNSTDGVKRILFSKAALQRIEAIQNAGPVAWHRIPRVTGPKNLGTSLTDAQSTAIKNGTWDDLFVGDYWVINGKNRRIGDLDYFYKTGDNASLGHDCLIVDDGIDLTGDGKTTKYMNETDTTEGGFKATKMWTDVIPNTIVPEITTAFGDHLFSHREYISNAVSSGKPSGGEWVDATYMLFNEAMFYGGAVNGNNSGGSGLFNIGCGKSQIALFRNIPEMMNRRQNIWLRDIVSATSFAFVVNVGGAWRGGASLMWYGVLGYYLIH